MNMRIIYILSMSLILLSGCKKYLDIRSNSGYNLPNTLKNLQALLDDAYIMNTGVVAFGEASADNYFLPDNIFNAFGINERNTYTWKNFNYEYPNNWANAYQVVYNANLVLDQLQTIQKDPVNEAQWNQVQASARFFRAHQFLSLVWTYAKAYNASSAGTDPGIALRTSSNQYVASVRASVADSYKQIIADLHASLTALPALAEHPMRPSKAAAYALLARTYLSMARYDSALYYANQSLQLKNQLMDFNDAQVVNVASTVPFKRFNPETIFYAQLSTQSSLFYFYIRADSSLYESYDNNDLRKQAYFMQSGDYYQFKATYTESNFDWFGGIATDEMYLIRAESRAQANDISSAMEDVNALLRKRYASGAFTDLTAANKEQALAIIYRERRKEMPVRGLRWSDIKRLNLAGENIMLHRFVNGSLISLPPNDNRYALPLPEDIIRHSGMPQNEQ